MLDETLRTSYEWTAEEWDREEHIDSDFANKLKDLYPIDRRVRIGLVKSIGNEIDGLVDREWAYADNGKLPENFSLADFSEGAKVPKRFLKEWERNK